MSNLLIADCAPLIDLNKLNCLHFLDLLSNITKIIIPFEVAKELEGDEDSCLKNLQLVKSKDIQKFDVNLDNRALILSDKIKDELSWTGYPKGEYGCFALMEKLNCGNILTNDNNSLDFLKSELISKDIIITDTLKISNHWTLIFNLIEDKKLSFNDLKTFLDNFFKRFAVNDLAYKKLGKAFSKHILEYYPDFQYNYKKEA